MITKLKLTREEKRFVRSNKVRHIIRWPPFFLRWLGYMNSFGGDEAINNICEHWYERLRAREIRFILITESILAESRKEAAIALSTIALCRRKITDIPTDAANDSTPQAIRAARSSAAELLEIKNMIANAYAVIAMSGERINHIETVLAEKTRKLRCKTYERMNAYAAGVHKGKLKGYALPSYIYDDEALRTYHDGHQEIDMAIRNHVENKLLGG